MNTTLIIIGAVVVIAFLITIISFISWFFKLFNRHKVVTPAVDKNKDSKPEPHIDPTINDK